MSQATVSRVARGDPGVSPRLRERVLRVLAETGYKPDPSARSMRTGHSDMVAYAAPDLERANPRLLAALEAEAAHRHLGLLLWSTGPNAERLEVPRAVRGIFLVQSVEAGPLPARRFQPTVLLGFAAHQDQFDEVSGDDEASGYAVAKYFANAGRLQVAIVGAGASGFRPARCVEGFRRGVAVYDLHLPRSRVLDSQESEGGQRIADLLAGPTLPQAVLCTEATAAREVVEVARAGGLRIPGDLSVVAFADPGSPVMGLLGLTAVHPPLPDLARAAFDLLAERLDGADGPALRRIVPNVLTAAASTSRAPLS